MLVLATNLLLILGGGLVLGLVIVRAMTWAYREGARNALGDYRDRRRHRRALARIRGGRLCGCGRD